MKSATTQYEMPKTWVSVFRSVRIKSTLQASILYGFVAITLFSLTALVLGFTSDSTTKRRGLIDVSHVIENGMTTYKGIPGPVMSDFLSREASIPRYFDGVQFLITKIEMVANTGTYLDAPYHRYENGEDLAALALEKLAYVKAIIIKANERKGQAIDESFFKGEILRDKAVIIYTGWDSNWRTDRYSENSPYITKGAAQLLADAGVRIVAIDSYNIDDTNDKSRPAHSILLKSGIPIVEHLCNLNMVPTDKKLEFNAVPAMLKDFSTFPVRAFIAWE